jgi:hypothetical protein
MRSRSLGRPAVLLTALAAAGVPLLVPSRAPLAAETAPAPPVASPPEVTPAGPFLNVKVLTDVTSKQEMRQRMRGIAASLGVRCPYCHVPGAADKDDKKEKRAAREMMRMVAHINETYLAEAEHVPAVTCWTCHRGETEPAREIPRAAYDAVDSMRPADSGR